MIVVRVQLDAADRTEVADRDQAAVGQMVSHVETSGGALNQLFARRTRRPVLLRCQHAEFVFAGVVVG